MDPTGLAPGEYAGTVLASSTGGSFETIAVILSVSSLPNLSTSPSSLNFQYQVQGSLPAPQNLLVLSTTGNPLVTASASTFSGGPWLSASGSGNTPFQVAVSVNPAGLIPGVYNGQVLLTSSGAANSPLSVSVTFTVSAAPVLTAQPTSLTFAHTQGDSAPPPSQQVKISSDSPVPVTALASTADGSPWLSATLSGNNTPTNITVSVNPSGLTSGNYLGTVTITSVTPGVSPLSIPVTFTIAAQPVLQALPSSVVFVFTPGGGIPAPVPVRIESTQTVNIDASVSPPTSWLAVTGGGTTPATLQVSVNPAGLAPGTYTSSILVTSRGAANSPLSIAVTLAVVTLPALTASPSALYLTAGLQETTSAPIYIQSTGVALTFTAAPSPSTPWLTVSGAATTPANVTVKASGAGLTPGSYSGAVIITSSGAVNSPLLVPVTFTVLGAPVLAVAPETINFSALSGGATQSQPVTVTLSGQPATSSQPLQLRPSPWMTIQSNAGGTFAVTADPKAVPPGEYLAGVAVTEGTASNSPIVVPVRLKVAGVPVEISSTAVASAAATGSTSASTQIVHVGGGPAEFTLDTIGSTWLTVSPAAGSIPVDLAFTTNPAGLAPGTYHGSVILHTKGAADTTFDVVLGVGDSTLVITSPQNLTFRFNAGDAAPTAQSVAVSSVTAGTGLQLSSGAPWLTTSSNFLTTPANFSVTINAAGLAPGQYHTEIALTAAGSSVAQARVPVDLAVDQLAAPRISSVNNGMSFYFPAAMAPGLIFSIFGRGLGPSTPVIPAISGGVLPTSLGGVQVLVNGIPSPLLYVSDSQINVVASFAVDGATAAEVMVRYLGVSSDPVDLTAVTSAPGIFSQNSTGSGLGAILNLDNSINSPSNPTSRGSYVAMYAGGAGQTVPPGVDGSISLGPTLPHPMLPVRVQVGGIDAEVSYAGAAPGFVAGALQVNFRIPNNAPTGEVFVVLKVGDQVSQPGLTVSVR